MQMRSIDEARGGDHAIGALAGAKHSEIPDVQGKQLFYESFVLGITVAHEDGTGVAIDLETGERMRRVAHQNAIG
jgi:hypothetical protein